MNRIRTLILLGLSLVAPLSFAQQATIFQMPSGTYVGFVQLPNGQTVALTSVQIIKVPGPNPIPVPPPVVTGKRDVAIIHESGLVTAKQASLHTYLQTNPTVVDWRKSKGHRLFILDPDGKDSAGQSSPITQRFVKAIPAGTKLPAIVILDQSSDAVYFAGELPADATGQSVMELVKRHGG